MDFSAIKTLIEQNIRTNNNEDITGSVLQNVLLGIIETLGDDAINDLISALGQEVTNRQNAVQGEADARSQADNTILGKIANILNGGYLYQGIAGVSTNPGNPTVSCFYFAKGAGTYTNFRNGDNDPIVITDNGLYALTYEAVENEYWEYNKITDLDDGVFDISRYHASGGTLATYADLAAALGASGANVPAEIRRGGMSVKFVHTSDNKYVQFRYMGTSTANANFANVTNWQGVDDVPTAGSNNLVKSGGANEAGMNIIKELSDEISSFSLNNFYLKADGKYDTTSTHKHGYIAVQEGEQYVLSNLDSVNDIVRYAFTTATTFSSGGDIPLVTGTSVVTVPHGSSVIITIPSGASYLMWNKGAGTGLFATLYKYFNVVKDIRDEVATNVLKKSQQSLTESEKNTVLGNLNVNKVDSYIKCHYTSDYESHNGYINGDGLWTNISSSQRTHVVCPVTGGDKIMIQPKDSDDEIVNYGFLSSYEPTEGQNTGIISFTSIEDKQAVEVTAPNNAAYLYFQVRSYALDLSPAFFSINSLILDKINNTPWYNIKGLNSILGDVTKCMNFVNGTCSTASNVPDWGQHNRLLCRYFLPCNLSQKKVVVTNPGSTTPRLDVLVGAQKGTDNFVVLQAWKGGNFEISLTQPSYDYMFFLIRWHDNTSISPNDISSLKFDLVDTGTGGDTTSILYYNDKKEVEPKIINLVRPYRDYSDFPELDCVTLLHFSDLHSNNTNLLRIKDFFSEYNSYIDGVIQTGDLVESFEDGMPAAYTNGLVNSFMNVIGNHESRYKVDGEYYYIPETDLYNTIFKPYISNWGVTQPAGAEANGNCYFYKDYKNVVRLIVIDCMHWNATQKTWLEGVLADAITNSLHVVCAIHIPPFSAEKNSQNPFDSIDEPMNAGGVSNQEIATCIKNFIDNNGVFVCWICGHIHDDVMGVGLQSGNFNNQLAISIATASVNPSVRFSTMARMNYDKTQDCFNLMSIDTVSKTIKLMRVGANYDRYMRRKNTMSYNYGTNQIIYTD